MSSKASWMVVGGLVGPALFALLAPVRAPADGKPGSTAVDYSRDIRPILAANCYACHGPDDGKRKGKLRLDLREEALKKAIKPGDPAGSSLIERITSSSAREVMPPADSKLAKLSAQQVELLRRWIEQGARFDAHWAYLKPVRPTPPVSPPSKGGDTWVRNPLDQFIRMVHEQRNFQPAPEADRITLIRRLAFDLSGLPPTPVEVEAFLSDQSADAYEKLVDRLLASKHYGERMAMYWLDLVRFADTCGYHSDNHRDVYLYRDYIIDSFNNNTPFDRFTMEQLAGDLLPNATREQKVASGYNRVLMTTEEGGAQAKEYLAKYSADRLRNVSVVWMATTLGCCECHNHKFDPFTTRDFYSLAAFFADIKEKAVGRQDQDKLPSEALAAQFRALQEKIAPLASALAAQTPELESAQADWELEVRNGAVKGVPAPVLAALAVLTEKRTPQQKQVIAAHFRGFTPLLARARQQLAELNARKAELEKTVPATLISSSVEPRMMRILPRGNWLDDSGEVVQPAVPALFGPLDVQGRRANRLDLARWLTAADNPLVARVFVNRLWKLFFGQGLVKSLEDFGTQGTLPSHPQLLDWLAVEFMSPSPLTPLPSPSGRGAGGEGAGGVRGPWNVKHVIRLMLTSSTYRQDSIGTREQRERDPGNLWLARQGRFRLDAEMVRDNALAVSGLLVRKVGGASAKPYQPAGYWQFLNFPTRTYVHDTGPEQYRRGLYTYWQRSFLHPSLLAFDAPSREECTAERPRSSTPLQALVLLNDPTYVEAARVLAERLLRDGGSNPADRLAWTYRQVLSRPIQPEEAKLLTGLYRKHLTEYTADRKAAEQLIKTGLSPVPKDIDPAELAAWTSVVRVVLNLHETITRN